MADLGWTLRQDEFDRDDAYRPSRQALAFAVVVEAYGDEEPESVKHQLESLLALTTDYEGSVVDPAQDVQFIGDPVEIAVSTGNYDVRVAEVP